MLKYWNALLAMTSKELACSRPVFASSEETYEEDLHEDHKTNLNQLKHAGER